MRVISAIIVFIITVNIANSQSLKENSKFDSKIYIKKKICANTVFSLASLVEMPQCENFFFTLNNDSLSQFNSANLEISEPGLFYFSLFIEEGGAYKEYLSDSFYILPSPKAEFSVEKTCYGNKTVFTNFSEIFPEEFLWNVWDFGDGQGSMAKNPVHNYLYPGKKSVMLKVMSAAGCKDSAIMETELFQQAKGQLLDTVVAPGSLIQLTASDGVSWQWTANASNLNFTEKTLRTNVFETTMFIISICDYNGCYYTDSLIISTSGKPNFFIPNYFSPFSTNNHWKVNYGQEIEPSLLQITNIQGQNILFTEDFTGTWNGATNKGSLIEPGFYLYKLIVGKYSFSGIIVVEY